MQFDYRPRDPERFRTILPPGVETLRVHTVDDSEPRFLRLLRAVGRQDAARPCSSTRRSTAFTSRWCARRAMRSACFYGTGLDVLALENFVLRK